MRSLADWLEQQQKSHPRAIDLTLDRVRDVARRLDLLTPAHRVVTVAGTNGKGSTVAYLDAVFRASGLRCGRFTSPHLRRYNERICVDGVEASDAQLIGAFERIDAARGPHTLTFFEYNALAALDHFRRAQVDVAVLEVGLGGRLDATNIIDADAGIVCSIGLDHTDWLGDSLEAIGREKAGIFRRDRPAILATANLPASVFAVIAEVGAQPVVSGRDYFFRRHADRWEFECAGTQLRDLPLPALTGDHQLGNAAAALAAIAVTDLGVTLSAARVADALTKVCLPGRFQIVPGDVEWVLDVAHNVPAALELSANLRRLSRRHTIAVCGILGDKDMRGIASALAAEVDVWILVALEGPRAVPTEELERQLPPGAVVAAHASDAGSGCEIARQVASKTAQPGARILVFGSFLTVGPALDFLGI